MPDESAQEDYEYHTYFVGCTCEHEQDQHGWGHCKVPGCSCVGGYEE